MPKVLPRHERTPIDDCSARLPEGLFAKISTEIQELQAIVLEVDGEPQDVGTSRDLDLSRQVAPGRKRKRADQHSSGCQFDLNDIRRNLDSFVLGAGDRLEFQPLSKTRRKQVCP